MPEYRCRLVGQEIAKGKRTDLYVATPPLEALKLLIAKCAMAQKRRKPIRIAVIDVRRAYFNAKAKRPI